MRSDTSISEFRRRLDGRVVALAAHFGGRIPNSFIAAPIFLALGALTAFIVMMTASAEISGIKRARLDDIGKWRTAAMHALDAANRDVTAPPCSAKFQEDVRAIAFWPDGLNEFLYIPEATVLCSVAVSSFSPPVDLGRPDITSHRAGFSLWIDRGLAALGLAGSRGSILRMGKFATVIPNISPAATLPPWIASEFVALSDDESVVAISGTSGLFSTLRAGAPAIATYLASGVSCSDDRAFCVAAAVDFSAWTRYHLLHVAVGLLGLMFAAYVVTLLIADKIRDQFSFSARLVRNLSADTIVMAYQPIYDLNDRRISGVEALVRFRDVDGNVVYPDKFIGLILDAKRTIELTRLVVEAVKSDLNRTWTADTELQVNVNIFPRDLASDDLLKICEGFFDGCNPRLKLAVEVVEYEAIKGDELAAVVSRFHSKGVKVYIDDFGSGYSSVESVSTLPVDGIKLDRSFAMAPSDSVMGRMFLKVIELLKTTGKPLVVEGIEDPSKIGELRRGDLARYAQGYGIGRPMPIKQFLTFAASSPAYDFGGVS